MTPPFKTLPLSLALHAVLIVVFSAAGRFVLSERTPMVIDFRLVDDAYRKTEAVPSAPIKPPGEKSPGEGKRTIRELQEKHPLPPSLQEHAAAEARMHPAPEEERIPPVSAPAPVPGGASSPSKHAAATTEGREADTPPARGSAASAAKRAPAEWNGAGGREAEGAPEGMRKRYLREQFASIRDRVMRGLSYPLVARRKGWEGKVLLSFTVAGDGSIGAIKIVQSSGREILDQGAVEAVRKAAPFPRPPVEAEVILPVVYQLRE